MAKKTEKQPRKWWQTALLVLLAVILAGGASFAVWYFCLRENAGLTEEVSESGAEESSEEIVAKTESKEKYYSVLTGLEITDPGLNNSPVYCVQVPNGTDGARPQAGLTHAGVIFEAIAERGITRFAAIFQNADTGVIGPIRSLRMYYLEWDTPFDCTITHAGGAADALAAVRSGGYRDLTENYSYMWRGSTSNNVVARRWNNLFTSTSDLAQFGTDKGYSSSNMTGFTHMTPDEAVKAKAEKQATNKLDIDAETEANTDELVAEVTEITLHYGSMPNYNPVYTYNIETNTYYRGYESGAAHEVYDCPEGVGEVSPELSCGETTQLNPSVVIAMMVQESLASDGYHENITTIGSGKAYIFQNGTAIEGTWQKKSRAEQIKFYDSDGREVALVPGQAIVSAVPNYGSVSYK